MKTSAYILISLIWLLSASCKKHDHEHDHVDDTDNNTVTANITILSPEEQAQIIFGQSIPLEADVLGTGELHGYAIYVRTADNDSLVYSSVAHTHAKAYQIRKTFTNNIARTVECKVIFNVAVTHSGQSISKEVRIRAVRQ